MRQPRQVLVYVVRQFGAEWQYLLLHRIQRGDDFWQGVSGGVEDDETCHQAAARELEEETGYVADRLTDLAFSYTFPLADKWRDLYAPGAALGLLYWPNNVHALRRAEAWLESGGSSDR
jgi:8-oxo-dGTP pyrophosphatase MutT (NUDIX family)